jgi:hypothetical protein
MAMSELQIEDLITRLRDRARADREMAAAPGKRMNVGHAAAGPYDRFSLELSHGSMECSNRP